MAVHFNHSAFVALANLRYINALNNNNNNNNHNPDCYLTYNLEFNFEPFIIIRD